MKAVLLFALGLLGVACAAPSRPAVSTPSAAGSAAASASSKADSTAQAPEHDSGTASAPPQASATPVLPRPVIIPAAALEPSQQVVFDPPYKLGSRPRLPSASESSREDYQLAQWNGGGRSGKWHPQPRVIVDVVKVRGGGLESGEVLRQARKDGYRPIRKCYDAALVDDPKLHGKMRLRFTIRSSGAVSPPRVVGRPTLEDDDVPQCIAKGFGALKFPRPTRGSTDVTLEITLYPGDAPIRGPEDPPVGPGPGQIQMPLVQALIASQAGEAAQHCYAGGLGRHPGLWGRLALRADVSAEGQIRDVTETESTFPDPLTAQCVASAVQLVRLPPPERGDLRVIIPMRFGNP